MRAANKKELTKDEFIKEMAAHDYWLIKDDGEKLYFKNDFGKFKVIYIKEIQKLGIYYLFTLDLT